MADDSQSRDTPLHTAASCGDLDEVRELLKTKQYEVDARNSHSKHLFILHVLMVISIRFGH